MTTFKAPLSDLSRIITYVVIAVLVVPTILMVNMARQGNPEVLIVLGVVLAALAVTAFFRVKSYNLNAAALRVQRPVGEVVIARARLRSATPVTNKELGFGLRLFGSGGFAGYLGIFFYRHAGKVTAYATNEKAFILLRTHNDKQYLISPADGAGFLKELGLPAEEVNG